MKILTIALFLLFSFFSAWSQGYKFSDQNSKVNFVIKNFGLKTSGTFVGLTGTAVFNPKSLHTSKFSVSVNSKTINTGNSTRDKHLKKSEYFDVEKYPQISFTSTKISESTIAGRFVVIGNLTIKGITKTIQFGFEATPAANGYIFTGEFEINRRDFGVGGSSLTMSNTLKVLLNVTAK